MLHFFKNWELAKQRNSIVWPIADSFSIAYNKGNFLHLVWKKGTDLQQNCFNVSDYQLRPALKKNPYANLNQ